MSANNIETFTVYPSGITSELGHLKTGTSTVEIFIEDTAIVSIHIWRALLRKIVPEKLEISIHSCGGRTEVISECEKQVEDGRRKLFIIDADMDILTGKKSPELDLLYRLPVYCVENFLLEETNIEKLCEFLQTKGKVMNYKVTFDFESWKSHNGPLFQNLFVCYATVQLAERVSKSAEKNVKYSVSKLCQSAPNQDMLHEDKVKKRVENLYENLNERYSVYKIDGIRDKIENNAKCHDFLKYVCGKSHLFELIYLRVIRNFTEIDINLAKKWLAEHASSDFDPQLKKIISGICK